MLNRMIPAALLTFLVAGCCDQPMPNGPDGGLFRVRYPDLTNYADAKAACESHGQRLVTSTSYSDRSDLIAMCQLGGDGSPCWTDDWGSRSAADGGGTGVAALSGTEDTYVFVPVGDLPTFQAYPICETP